jgi:DNA polymerase elongation subunit (family B)
MEFPRKPFAPIDPKKDVLEFQITDLYIPEADRNKEKDDDELYSILIYGTCKNGATVCANVDKFIPFFYVKPPENWETLPDDSFAAKVEDFKAHMMHGTYRCRFNTQEYDRRIIPRRLENHFDNLTIVHKKDFWGFTNNKIFRFMKVEVKSLQLFNSLKYYFKAIEKEGFKLYESNIDPFLKYIHVQDIKPCGWVRIENKKYIIGDDISRCDYNIQVKYDKIKPINVNQIAPLIITSFDIECSSSHGDFPVAIKNYSKVAQDLGLVVKAGYDYDEEYLVNWLQNIFLTDIVIDENTDLKINKVYSKRKITSDFVATVPKLLQPILKDMAAILDTIASSVSHDDGNEVDDDDEDCKKKNMTVRELNEEEEKLAKLLGKVLPPLEGDKIIQIGTTVHRYGSDEIIYKNIVTLNTCNDIEDCDVVPCRTEKELLTKWKEVMNNLNSDIVTGYNIFGFDMEYIWNRAKETGIIDEFAVGLGRLITRKCSLVEQKLSSSALGDNILNYLDMDGMVLIDLLKVMQREQKLDSYKLDNVASIFLGDKKNDLKPQEIFEKFRGTAEDRCIIAKYCIQDCCLVNRLMHKLKILENNIGMGNVCLVPLNFLFRRGQGIKIFSLVAKQCMDRGSLIPTIKSFRENVEDDNDGYEGAVVLEPKEGIYLNEPVVVFDYGSLYPSSMIARNLSHDTYILDEKYMVHDDPNIEYTKVCHDIYEGLGDKKKKTGVKECIFAQYKDGRKGIIPEILNMLLQERKNTRTKIEYQTAILKDGSEVSGSTTTKADVIEYSDIDTGNTVAVNKEDIVSVKDTYSRFEQDVFDSLQLAYKITANSLYGQIGARTSSIYLKDIAASTTATGREMIMMAKDFVEKQYNAEVIYGDTDSIFCKFPLQDGEGNTVYGNDALPYAIKIGQHVEKNIVQIMPKPQKLNYEKCLYPFILFSKKRYVGNLYETDVKKFKQKSMGIVLKRRDNAQIVKKIYGGAIDIILNKQDLRSSIEFLQEELDDLVAGKTPITELVISKSLRASYKDPSKIAHKVLADRIGARDPGNRPVVNERIPFVYIKTDKPNALQGDRIENPEYIVHTGLTPDYLHYITNQIMKPVLQLYALCLDQLPGYEKCDDYWSQVEEQLLTKPMYVDDTRRKARIENLKLMHVKELLFDKYINMLSEPKVKKARAAKTNLPVITNGTDVVAKKPRVSKKKEETKVEMNVEADVEVIADGFSKAFIKITKNQKSGNIVSDAYVLDGKQKIWTYTNDSKTDKDNELINIIMAMIEHDKSKKYIINVNCAPFVKDYTLALGKYNEMVRNKETNVVENAFKDLDAGRIKDIGKIKKYWRLLELSEQFKFATKS